MSPDSEILNDPAMTPSPDQLRELYHLMGGFRVSQGLYVIAKLGIADLLKDRPLTSDQIAVATGSHEPSLFRLLRFLTAVGVFHEVAPRVFGLTPLGAGLRSDVPGSMLPNTLMLIDEAHWPAWGQLLHTIHTGETAFGYVHGADFFDYFSTHAGPAETFHRAMTANTARSGAVITRAYDFSGIRRVVDVGGGRGLFLAIILQAFPAMHGVLFDRPEVARGAAETLEAAGVADRCEIVGGNFFAGVPADGDAYLLRQIIHDWNDEQSVAILAHCRHAMRDSGKVLLVERGVSLDYRETLGSLHLDMEMLVNLGGIQRTDEEYRVLVAAAGLHMQAIVPLGDTEQFKVFECVAAPGES